jgi:hypothetical protein
MPVGRGGRVARLSVSGRCGGFGHPKTGARCRLRRVTLMRRSGIHTVCRVPHTREQGFYRDAGWMCVFWKRRMRSGILECFDATGGFRICDEADRALPARSPVVVLAAWIQRAPQYGELLHQRTKSSVRPNACLAFREPPCADGSMRIATIERRLTLLPAVVPSATATPCCARQRCAATDGAAFLEMGYIDRRRW